MCKRVNYKDMMFIIEFSMNKFDEVMHLPPAGQHIARVGIKFGDGLMGKGAEIRKVTSITEWEGEDGILVIVSTNWRAVSHETCYIKNIKDKEDVINLGPADFLSNNYFRGKYLNETGVALLGPSTPK